MSAPRSSSRGSTIRRSSNGSWADRTFADAGRVARSRAVRGSRARLDDAHRRARRRRLGVLGDLLGRARRRASIVPGTGIHLNNMLGEQDLNPLGFHRHPPGRRMPSMMSPTIVLRDGSPELAARQRRLQPDPLGDPADDRALRRRRYAAPRTRSTRRACTTRTGSSTPSRGSRSRRSSAPGWTVSRFRDRNLFFGGAQAVMRGDAAAFSGGGDPRRGGAAVVVVS